VIFQYSASNAVTFIITGNGVDYTSGTYRVVFPPGVTTVPFNIPINRDSVLEGQESFRLLIKKDALPTGIYLSKYEKATVTIHS